MITRHIGTLWANARRACCTRSVRKTAASCGDHLVVNFRSFVTSNTYLGNNVNFNGMKMFGSGKIVIGDNFHSGHECIIISSNHDYDHSDYIPYGEASIAKDVVIEDNVWIGTRVMILPGTHIGEGAIIQGGCVVGGEIPAYAIAGGYLAKPFGSRDVTHYERLKEEKKFL